MVEEFEDVQEMQTGNYIQAYMPLYQYYYNCKLRVGNVASGASF